MYNAQFTVIPLTELVQLIGIIRIYHWSPMQTEKSQPEGKWIMPGTRFTSFPALSVDPRVGLSRSASETNDRLFCLPIIE